MRLVAHRGNIYGPNETVENHPDNVTHTLSLGYDCEVDVRFIDDKYYLGHDYPKYEVSLDFLRNEKLWCHAKDGTTLRKLLWAGVHCFYDDNPNNNYTLTSRNYIWHWDGKSQIYIMDSGGLIGICSDYVGYLK